MRTMSGSAGSCSKITTSSTPLSAATTCAAWPTPSSRRRNSAIAGQRLRDPDALRHGRAGAPGDHSKRPARAGLSAGGRIAARHFLSDSAADGEHLEHFVSAPDLRRSKRHRRLIKAPARPLKRDDDTPELSAAPADLAQPFRNEPPIDFSQPENRRALCQSARRSSRAISEKAGYASAAAAHGWSR